MFEVAADLTAPENTTVASYQVTRLGQNVMLVANYAETRRGWTPVAIATAADANADGKFEVLRTLKTWPDPAVMVGIVLTTTAGVAVGTVASAVLETVAQTPQNPLGQQTVLTLGATEGLGADTPVALEYPATNFFGIQINNTSPNGRSWQLILNSTAAAQANRMQLMLFRIQFATVKAAFEAAQVVKTDAEIQDIVIQLGAAGSNLDSLIASELEVLEKDRRSGAFESSSVLGNAPQV